MKRDACVLAMFCVLAVHSGRAAGSQFVTRPASGASARRPADACRLQCA